MAGEGANAAQGGLTFGLEHIIRPGVEHLLSVVHGQVLHVADRIVTDVRHHVHEVLGEVDVEAELVVGCHLIVLAEGVDHGVDALGVRAGTPQVAGVNGNGGLSWNVADVELA